jgi:hypothetical protein
MSIMDDAAHRSLLVGESSGVEIDCRHSGEEDRER